MTSAETLSMAASLSIREAILNGFYKPAQPLREEELSRRLNINRSCVREALLIVANSGLVEMRPRRGAAVVSLSPRFINEIFTLRARLEAFSVGLAISSGAMTADRIALILEAYENLKKLSTIGTKQALVEADMHFHWAICEPCQHQVLLRVLGELQAQTRLCISYTKLYNSDLQSEAETHLPIVRSIQDLDAQRAERSVLDHILNANQRLLLNMSQSEFKLDGVPSRKRKSR